MNLTGVACPIRAWATHPIPLWGIWGNWGRGLYQREIRTLYVMFSNTVCRDLEHCMQL